MKILLLLTAVMLSATNIAQNSLSVYFDVDAASVDAVNHQKIQNLFSQDVQIIELVAYCDTTASVSYNDRLAKRRLESVIALIDSNQEYKTRALGEKHNLPPEDLSKQRRVDIFFSIPSPPVVEEVERVDAISDVVIEEVAEQPSDLNEFLSNKEQKEVLIQTTILFYNASGQYLPESTRELEALYDFMKDNPDVSAHIRGHICCNPYTEFDDISQARARTVAYYLIDRRIDRSRITYKGYGTSMPYRSPELTEEDRKLNRRVDVLFTRK